MFPFEETTALQLCYVELRLFRVPAWSMRSKQLRGML